MGGYIFINVMVLVGVFVGRAYGEDLGALVGLVAGFALAIAILEQVTEGRGSEGFWLRHRGTLLAVVVGGIAMLIGLKLFQLLGAVFGYMVGYWIGLAISEKLQWSGSAVEGEQQYRVSAIFLLVSAASLDGPPTEREKGIIRAAAQEILGPMGYGGEADVQRLMAVAANGVAAPLDAAQMLSALSPDVQSPFLVRLFSVLYSRNSLSPMRSKWISDIKAAAPRLEWSLQGLYDRSPEANADIRSIWLAELGLTVDADEAAVKEAYRRKASEYHPDRHSSVSDNLRELAEKKMAAVNAAYEGLTRQFASTAPVLQFMSAEGGVIAPSPGVVCACWLCGQKNRLPMQSYGTCRCGKCSCLLGLPPDLVRAVSEPQSREPVAA